MAFTYDDSLATDRDKLRFLIGDTDSANAQFSDGEIAYMNTKAGSPDFAAIGAARVLAAKYSRLADTSIETVSVSHSQKAKAYLTLADALQSQYDQSAASSGGISATGIGIKATNDVYLDDDRLIDDTIKGMFSNPQYLRPYPLIIR